MILYFTKAILCALFFLFVYMILFERENMHRFKRHYLLFSLAFSFAIPLVALDITVPQLNEEANRFYAESKMNKYIPEQIVHLISQLYSESNTIVLESGSATLLASTTVEGNISSVSLKENAFPDYALMLIVLYITVSFALFLRLSRNLLRLLYSAKTGRQIIHNNRNIILIKENLAPFSFGKYIYINEDDYKNGLIAEEMIRHEQAHLEQHHSLDIILIELLITFLWFNPALYIYRRKIKQNHEFMADEAVIKANNDVTRYQNILIGIISKSGSTGLASSLNYSTIKKRFIMMKKETSQRKARCIKVLLMPVMLLAICMFSTHTIANEPSVIIPESTDATKSQEEESIIPRKGVSDELLKEYQSIVSKYIKSDSTWSTYTLSDDDRNRLYIINVQMNEEQQAKQLITLVGPFNTPFNHRKPNNDEWNSAKRAGRLWLDGKRAETSELDKYTRHDIYFFFNNYINEEKTIFQSAVWTKKGFDEYMEKYKDRVPVSVLLEIFPQVWHRTFKTNTSTIQSNNHQL